MQITLKLFAFFREGRFKEEQRHYTEPIQVQDIVSALGIKAEEVGVVMCNSRHCEFTYWLKDGDTLAIFPVIGGG